MNRLLALQAQAPNIAGAFLQGQQVSNQNRLLDLQEKRAVAGEAQAARELALKQAPIIGKVMENATTPELWEQGRQTLTQFGVDVTKMPPFSPQAHQQLMSIAREPEKFGAPVAGVGPDGKAGFVQVGDRGTARPVQNFAPAPKTEALPEVSKLIAARDALPPDDPNRKIYDDAISKSSGRADKLLSPQEMEQRIQIATAGRPSTEVKVDTKAGEGLVKLDVGTIGDMQGAVQNLRTIKPKLDLIEGALKKFETGFAGDKILTLKQIFQRAGFKAEGVSEGELIQSLVSEMAPQMRVPGSGATSDFEMQAFINALPNLTRTPQGNKLVVASLRTMIDRKQKELDYSRKYFRENGNSLEGVQEAMDRDLGTTFARPKSPDEAAKLPKGSLFFDPEGEMRIVP